VNKSEKEWGERVRALGCLVCRRLGHLDTPCDLHHVRQGRLGVRGTDVIGLCPNHHRNGPKALHVMGKRAFKREFGLTELDLLDDVKKLLA